MSKRHGMSHQRIHNIWCSMRQRCEKPGCSGYWKYGAKGIRVCDEWQVFENFMNWAYANGYSDDLSIDRVDPNGDYEPSNCRWVSQKIQQNNRTNNIRITYNGETHNIEEWSEITGLSCHVIYDRNHRGWPPERIFEQKKRKSPAKKTDAMKEETASFRIYFDKSDDQKKIASAIGLLVLNDSFMNRISEEFGRNDAASYKFPNGQVVLAWRNQTGIVFDFRKQSQERMRYDRRPEDGRRD